MNEVITAISTVGFPICSFLICGAFLKYVYDKSLAMFDRAFTEVHGLIEAVNKNGEAINDNTKTLAELVEEVRNK